jgi:hypothetical protein
MTVLAVRGWPDVTHAISLDAKYSVLQQVPYV